MVIFLNLDGTAQKVVPERIFRGSNEVTEITVIGAFPDTTALEIGFTLPSGESIAYAPMQYVQRTDGDVKVAVWTYSLRSAITQYVGRVAIAINAIDRQKHNCTSYQVAFNVEQSLLPSLPPEPVTDIYELILLYLQQNSLELVALEKRVTEVEKVTVKKVLLDFTVDTATGEGIKYYTDGTTATVQFPTGGDTPIFRTDWVTVIEFKSTDFTEQGELAFGSAQTGFKDSKYLAVLDRVGSATYESGEDTVPEDKQGYWQTANTFFKGSDGSILLQFNKAFDGRLTLLGGNIDSQSVVTDILFKDSVLTVKKNRGTDRDIDLKALDYVTSIDIEQTSEGAELIVYSSESEPSKALLPVGVKSVELSADKNNILVTYDDGRVVTLQDGGEPQAKYYAEYSSGDWIKDFDNTVYINIPASVHNCGIHPIVNTGNTDYNISINRYGDVTLRAISPEYINITII